MLTAAVWAGLTLPAVLARIENGTWPGLASFYTRYRNPRTRRNALLADWHKALAYVTAQQARKPTQSLVRNSPTSEPPSHGGAPPTSIKINNGPAERRRNTSGSGPGGPRSACWNTTGTATGRATGNAGCCGPSGRPR